MATIKCVMLDLGNTLISSFNEKRIVRIYTKVFKKYGYEITSERVTRTRKIESLKHLKEHYGKTRKLHRPHLMIRRVLKKLGYNPSEKELHEMTHEIGRLLHKSYKLYPGTLQVFSDLKNRNIKIALVSNGVTPWVEKTLKRFDIKKYFDFVIVSDQVGKEKSSLLPFKHVLKEFEIKPEECLMVGDRLDEDMHAKKLGIWTCHAAYDVAILGVGPRMKPDFTIKSIRQLPKIVDKINKISSK